MLLAGLSCGLWAVKVRKVILKILCVCVCVCECVENESVCIGTCLVAKGSVVQKI